MDVVEILKIFCNSILCIEGFSFFVFTTSLIFIIIYHSPFFEKYEENFNHQSVVIT